MLRTLASFVGQQSQGQARCVLPNARIIASTITGGGQNRGLASKPARVDFFYDIISPYTYVGYELMMRCNKTWGTDMRLRPVRFHDMIRDSGNVRAPAGSNRIKYIKEDILRNAEYHGITFNAPAIWPAVWGKGTGTAMKVLAALEMAHPTSLHAASCEFWKRLYVTDQDVSTLESCKIALTAAKVDTEFVEDLGEQIRGPHVEGRLHDNKDEALDSGAFGVPSFLVRTDKRTELFWGSDRFYVMAHILGEEEPVEALSKKC